MSDEYNLDGTVENKREVLAQIRNLNRQTKPTDSNLNNFNSSISSEDDPFATDGDSDATYSPQSSSGSNSSTESILNVENSNERKKRKLKSKQRQRQKKKKSVRPKKNVQSILLQMNDDLEALSAAATKLEQEIAVHRDLPYVKLNTVYTTDSPPSKSNSKTLSNNFNIPTKTIAEALQLNEMLKEKNMFEEVLVHTTKIYGNIKQRVKWGMTRRVLEALMDKHCLTEFTWTGKSGIKGIRRQSIRDLKLVHKIIVETLSKVDTSYTYDLFKSDMVKHVVKYANIRCKKL